MDHVYYIILLLKQMEDKMGVQANILVITGYAYDITYDLTKQEQ